VIRTFADSNWPVVAILVSVWSCTLAMTPFGRQLGVAVSEAFASHTPIPPIPSRPDVLVATTDPDDVNCVAATVVPRRYRVLSATSAEAAQRILRSNAGRIGVIIVNGKSSDGRRLAKLAEGLAPEAKVIRLSPNHGLTDLASEVMAVI
jgi:hypothetical protein